MTAFDLNLFEWIFIIVFFVPALIFLPYGIWRILVAIYRLLKRLFWLLDFVIRYGPRKGWRKFAKMDQKVDMNADVPPATTDMDIVFDL